MIVHHLVIGILMFLILVLNHDLIWKCGHLIGPNVDYSIDHLVDHLVSSYESFHIQELICRSEFENISIQMKFYDSKLMSHMNEFYLTHVFWWWCAWFFWLWKFIIWLESLFIHKFMNWCFLFLVTKINFNLLAECVKLTLCVGWAEMLTFRMAERCEQNFLNVFLEHLCADHISGHLCPVELWQHIVK